MDIMGKMEKGGPIEHDGFWMEKEDGPEMVIDPKEDDSAYKIGYLADDRKVVFKGPDGEEFEIRNCFIEQNIQMHPIVGGQGEPVIDPLSELPDKCDGVKEE